MPSIIDKTIHTLLFSSPIIEITLSNLRVPIDDLTAIISLLD